MSTYNSNSLIDEIKSRCNIIDVIGSVVKLKKAGSNYKGLCPFHNEKTPSFVVSETKQIFTCFGCGATGDVISFVQKYYQLEFMQACEKLAEEYSIDITAYKTAQSRNKDEYYEINREAAKFFYKALRSSENPGYSYMARRGITPETLNKFGIGYADDRWDSLYRHMKSLGYEEKQLLELGLISESKGKYFDKFRSRVIFPIMNTNGKVIGFGGRIIGDGNPKYLNSQETPVFSKKNNLYALNITRQEINKANQAILVEGYMDAVSLYQHGVRQVSASLGTALTENQSRLLKRYTENVVLSYDADEAGMNAALRGMDILHQQGLHVKVLHVTDGKDPDEYIKAKGRSEFMKLVDEALPFADYKFHVLAGRFNLKDMEGRIAFLKEAVKVLRQLSPIEADIYIKRLSEKMKISEGAIRQELSAESTAADNERHRFYQEETPKTQGPEITQLEKHLLKLLMSDKKYLAEITEHESAFASQTGKAIYEALKEQYSSRDDLDRNLLMDNLDETLRKDYSEIEDNIRFAAKEDSVFEDCMSSVRRNELLAKEKELMLRLSLADEEGDDDIISKLMKELKEIQMLINNERSI